MIRAFLAMELSDEIRERYAGLYRSARDRVRDLRWVRPENLHITLRFLGDTSEKQVEPLRREIEPALQQVAPFRVSIGEPGCFGPRSVPQVLWYSLEEGVEPLGSLAAELEAAACRSGFPREGKPWRGHITVARNRRKARCDDWPGLLSEAGLSGLTFEARAVTLFSSVLGAQGPSYSVLWKAPMSGNRDTHESH